MSCHNNKLSSPSVVFFSKILVPVDLIVVRCTARYGCDMPQIFTFFPLRQGLSRELAVTRNNFLYKNIRKLIKK